VLYPIINGEFLELNDIDDFFVGQIKSCLNFIERNILEFHSLIFGHF
jgi:hypothetical protein